jgi:hypothetical membrane protein
LPEQKLLKLAGNVPLAGALIFFGSLLSFAGITASEAVYPGYHVTQVISDLGVGPAAAVFNTSECIVAFILLAAAYLLWTAGIDRVFCSLMILIAAGQAGVCIFPENSGTPHLIAAVTVFICGFLITVASSRVFTVPWAWISEMIGIIMITAIIFIEAKIYLGLGIGGMERMIAGPLLIWGLVSGMFFMSSYK